MALRFVILVLKMSGKHAKHQYVTFNKMMNMSVSLRSHTVVTMEHAFKLLIKQHLTLGNGQKEFLGKKIIKIIFSQN